MDAVWFSGGLALVLFVGLSLYLAPLKPGVLAIQLSFTPEAFARIVAAWSPAQLARYRRHLPIDGLLLLSYGAFGYLLATRTNLFAGSESWARMLGTWALPAAAAFDAIENLLHGWLTGKTALHTPVIHVVAGTVSATKWGLVLIFGGLVAHALLTRI
ncbi:MAG: hypothetical protein LC125_05045 [Burkholderiales bacterium]|nr:hypothetical protein [Burkholderiales bacterium]